MYMVCGGGACVGIGRLPWLCGSGPRHRHRSSREIGQPVVAGGLGWVGRQGQVRRDEAMPIVRTCARRPLARGGTTSSRVAQRLPRTHARTHARTGTVIVLYCTGTAPARQLYYYALQRLLVTSTSEVSRRRSGTAGHLRLPSTHHLPLAPPPSLKPNFASIRSIRNGISCRGAYSATRSPHEILQ